MEKDNSITKHFGSNLAELLSNKILEIFPEFPKQEYVDAISRKCDNLSYTGRIELHADELARNLPVDFKMSSQILVSILGEENQHETGMFTAFYWVIPIGKFIEKNGINNMELSLWAIEEITKRSTGEYAIRPFIRKYPEEVLKRMSAWAKSENFHLRRLASEGLRPKLPWATKLDTFINNPGPVFAILELLKNEEVMFVKKSVANHLTDWLKVNKPPTIILIKDWNTSDNRNTKWIISRATRKIGID